MAKSTAGGIVLGAVLDQHHERYNRAKKVSEDKLASKNEKCGCVVRASDPQSKVNFLERVAIPIK